MSLTGAAILEVDGTSHFFSAKADSATAGCLLNDASASIEGGGWLPYLSLRRLPSRPAVPPCDGELPLLLSPLGAPGQDLFFLGPSGCAAWADASSGSLLGEWLPVDSPFARGASGGELEGALIAATLAAPARGAEGGWGWLLALVAGGGLRAATVAPAARRGVARLDACACRGVGCGAAPGARWSALAAAPWHGGGALAAARRPLALLADAGGGAAVAWAVAGDGEGAGGGAPWPHLACGGGWGVAVRPLAPLPGGSGGAPAALALSAPPALGVPLAAVGAQGGASLAVFATSFAAGHALPPFAECFWDGGGGAADAALVAAAWDLAPDRLRVLWAVSAGGVVVGWEVPPPPAAPATAAVAVAAPAPCKLLAALPLPRAQAVSGSNAAVLPVAGAAALLVVNGGGGGVALVATGGGGGGGGGERPAGRGSSPVEVALLASAPLPQAHAGLAPALLPPSHASPPLFAFGAACGVRAVDVLLPRAALGLYAAPAPAAAPPPPQQQRSLFFGVLLALKGPLLSLGVFALIFFSGRLRRRGGIGAACACCARARGAREAGGGGDAGDGARGARERYSETAAKGARGGSGGGGGGGGGGASIEAEIDALMREVGGRRGGGGGYTAPPGAALRVPPPPDAAPALTAEEKRLLRRAREAALAPDEAAPAGALRVGKREVDEATAANRVVPVDSTDEE
jgi:hypothetical protein